MIAVQFGGVDVSPPHLDGAAVNRPYVLDYGPFADHLLGVAVRRLGGPAL
jgi:hypothetical protein